MFKNHVELCGVGPGRTVMAFTNTQSNQAYITALMGAVKVLGGDFFQIMDRGSFVVPGFEPE